MVLVPDPLAALAARQFGLVDRQQALTYLSSNQLRRRAEQGILLAQEHNVFRFAGAPVSWRQRAMAATLRAGPPVAVSGLSAGYLWKVEHLAPSELTITVPPERRLRSTSWAATRAPLPAIDVVERYGIPVTSPVRTIIDLSRLVPPPLLGRVADDLIRRRLLTLGELADRLASDEPLGRHRSDVVAELVALRRGDERRGASEREDWIWDSIARSGLPLPQRHVTVWIGDRWCELDLGYLQWRIGMEYDSAEFHRDLQRFHGDRAAELSLVGWLLLQITAAWTPDMLISRLGRAIDGRSAGGLR